MSKYVMCWQHYIGVGGGGILNKIFEIPIILWNWMSESYKKKRKMRFYACCFKKIQICFNESDIVTEHSVMNIMTANGAKMA